MRIVVPLGIEVGGAKLTTPWGEGGGGRGEEALSDTGDFCGLLLLPQRKNSCPAAH